MTGFVRRIIRVLSSWESELSEIAGTAAYKEGAEAGLRFRHGNPYLPGTGPHRHWEAGYKDGERVEMQIW